MKKLLFILLFLPTLLFSQRSNLLIEALFDDANPLSQFKLTGQQFCCTYSITQAPAPSGPGKAMRYELHSTDAIVSSSKRAEFELKTDAPETSERWYGLRYWLSNYGADEGAESILQWHDNDGSTPPLSLQVQSGRLRIMQSFKSGNIPTDIGAVVSNAWMDIVIHVKWTTATNGVLQVWRNGAIVVNKSNVVTNATGGSYMKIGINKWSWAPGGGSSSQTQRIFYIDEFRMGNERATYNDVAPTQLVVTPVTWGIFKYDQVTHQFSWSTETEQHVNYFFIDKSEDNGLTWKRVMVQPSQAPNGLSESTLNYTWKP